MKSIHYSKDVPNVAAVVKFYTKPDKNGRRHMYYMDKERMKEILVQCKEMSDKDSAVFRKADVALILLSANKPSKVSNEEMSRLFKTPLDLVGQLD